MARVAIAVPFGLLVAVLAIGVGNDRNAGAQSAQPPPEPTSIAFVPLYPEPSSASLDAERRDRGDVADAIEVVEQAPPLLEGPPHADALVDAFIPPTFAQARWDEHELADYDLVIAVECAFPCIDGEPSVWRSTIVNGEPGPLVADALEGVEPPAASIEALLELAANDVVRIVTIDDVTHHPSALQWQADDGSTVVLTVDVEPRENTNPLDPAAIELHNGIDLDLSD